MKNDFFKKRYHFIILFLLLLFYGINNYVWIKLSEFPAYADEAYHLIKSLDYLNILIHPTSDMFFALLNIDNLRPPLFHLCMAIVNFLTTNARLIPIITNLFFAGILFISIYYLGKRIKNENCGVLAAFTVAMYPYIFGLSRMALPDFASIAMACLSLCLLIYTDRFKKTFISILLGIAIGLGLLTKLTFIFFLAGPVLIMVIAVLIDKEAQAQRKRVILNLGLAIILAAIIGGVWYFPRFSFLWKTYITFGFQVRKPISPPETFSFASFIYYFYLLSSSQIAPFFTLLFFVGLISFLKSRDKLRLPIILWIITIYIIFTLINNKHSRATCAYLSIFALITAAGILRLQSRRLKRFLVYLIVFVGLFQFFVISYTNPLSTKIRLSFFSGEMIKGLTVPSYLYPITEVFFHYPRKGDWRIDDVISAIQEADPINRNATIGITDMYVENKTDWYDPRSATKYYNENFVTTNNDAINYFLRLDNLSYRIISLTLTKEKWKEAPMLDFIVSVMPIEDLAPSISRQYKLILQARVPDGSLVYVYKRQRGFGRILRYLCCK
jgi:hypothetical protein